jgi:hypothetical protein
VSASRLWSTGENTIINVSLEDGFIYFATGGTAAFGEEETGDVIEGNTVIAVFDADDNILWSWHIWSVGSLNDPRFSPVTMNGHSVMNRNLGAMIALKDTPTTPEYALESYGLYYQWGRKDPFIGPAAWDSAAPAALYNSIGNYTTHSYVVSDAETGTVEYAVSHPGAFIAGAKDNAFDWIYSGHKTDLWSATTKTIHDPCPAGWRIAPREIWAGFTTTGDASSDRAQFNVIEEEYKYGWTFKTDGYRVNNGGTIIVNLEAKSFFPAAGRRSFSPSLAATEGNYTNIVNDDEGGGHPVGFYWSAQHPAPVVTPALGPAPDAGALIFRHNWINPAKHVSETADYAAAGGFPVRCVAE